MKRDILIPKVDGVYMAVCHSYNAIFKSDDWYAYIINDKMVPLEQVLIVSKGANQKSRTATMRHKLEVLPAKSGAKVELILPEILGLTNTFQVTFFVDNQLFEKTFTFKANTITIENLVPISVLNIKGILVD